MKHLMIDLETLSVRPSARIVEIGWAVFEAEAPGVVHSSGAIAVDVGSQQGSVDAGAIDFWFKQPDESRLALAKAKKVSIKEALDQLDTELSPWGQYIGVWSHGPAFDMTILQNAYDRLGRGMPWNYRAIRDTRTLAESCKLVTGSIPDYPKVGVAHSAAGDCVNQALWVQAMLAALVGAKDPLA